MRQSEASICWGTYSLPRCYSLIKSFTLSLFSARPKKDRMRPFSYYQLLFHSASHSSFKNIYLQCCTPLLFTPPQLYPKVLSPLKKQMFLIITLPQKLYATKSYWIHMAQMWIVNLECSARLECHFSWGFRMFKICWAAWWEVHLTTLWHWYRQIPKPPLCSPCTFCRFVNLPVIVCAYCRLQSIQWDFMQGHS